MKTLKLIMKSFAVVLLTSSFALAEGNNWSSYEDHYTPRAFAQASAPKVSKADKIRAYAQDCFDKELSLWERQGRFPSADEADLILDACVNPRF